MKVVIIGAGPSGLYTAIKYRQAGFTDLVVYDPRAGNYTRPGHINANAFRRAQEGIKKDIWPNVIGHINDLEIGLYKEAKKLGIHIENKKFVRLHPDVEQPGVVLSNTEDNCAEETVAADYVFDCSGNRRVVVSALNATDPDSTLRLTTFADLPVRHHFLAYVAINKEDWKQLKERSAYIQRNPETIDPSAYTQSLLKLRKLGWKEFLYPRFYGREFFGEDKICMYFHAPENLSENDYEEWVQTVLELYSKPISYVRPPPGAAKTQFMPFTSKAQVLKAFVYKGKNLPTVVPEGDTLIDFDSYLAHGIYKGLKRINLLFEHLRFTSAHSFDFDSDNYSIQIDRLLQKQKTRIIDAAEETRHALSKALKEAEPKLNAALKVTGDPFLEVAIQDVLKDLRSRLTPEAKAEKPSPWQAFDSRVKTSAAGIFAFNGVDAATGQLVKLTL